jgi:hypothetical protein
MILDFLISSISESESDIPPNLNIFHIDFSFSPISCALWHRIFVGRNSGENWLKAIGMYIVVWRYVNIESLLALFLLLFIQIVTTITFLCAHIIDSRHCTFPSNLQFNFDFETRKFKFFSLTLTYLKFNSNNKNSQYRFSHKARRSSSCSSCCAVRALVPVEVSIHRDQLTMATLRANPASRCCLPCRVADFLLNAR